MSGCSVQIGIVRDDASVPNRDFLHMVPGRFWSCYCFFLRDILLAQASCPLAFLLDGICPLIWVWTQNGTRGSASYHFSGLFLLGVIWEAYSRMAGLFP
jgi:hypothetical protein